MSVSLLCRKCDTDLEEYNVIGFHRIRYCPYCGARVLKKQGEALLKKVSGDEIEGMIKEHVLNMLACCDGTDVSADGLAYKAWETENCDGVVFYHNYEADKFTMRHRDWTDNALECAELTYGDTEHYIRMKAECNDRFLVVAFILATEHFLYDQIGLEHDEGGLTKERIEEIKRLIKETPYDGGF
jgi:DNA-directed RNA polymerase subunit RPC12/RpoP